MAEFGPGWLFNHKCREPQFSFQTGKLGILKCQFAAIQRSDILDNGQAEPGTGNRFIQSFASLQRFLAFVGRQARAIIFYGNGQHRPTVRQYRGNRLRRNANLTARPFAAIVEQVSKHFLDILCFSAEFQSRLDPQIDLQPAVAIQPFKHTLQPLQDRLDLGDSADHPTLRRHPGPVQVEVDLIAHDIGLLGNFLSLGGRRGARFIGDHAQGCLQSVSEVANLRAGPVDDFTIGRNERIQFRDHGRDFSRIIPLKTFGFPDPDRTQRIAQHGQRPQSDFHLNKGGEQKPECEHHEGNQKIVAEGGNILVD